MNVERYENQVPTVNTDLLKKDEYSFAVLAKILQRECRLTLTDNKRFIICYSCEPYPVWVWLPDDTSLEEKEFVYNTLKENFEFNIQYSYNVKYNFASFLEIRASEDGYIMDISMNMLAYNCTAPVAPNKIAKGACKIATIDDLEIAVEYMNQFHNDVGIDKADIDTYRKNAQALIEEQRLFFWCDENNERVAMTSYNISGDKGSIGNVFTRHDKRRCGYGASLVYEVTLIIQKQGKMPILYTNADYIASNACYEKIGYIKQGSLCTVRRYYI